MCVNLYSLPQGNVPTRESIHLYYQNHMMKLSEESGLDSIDKNPSQASGLQASERMDSLDSAASRDSISRYWFNFILGKTEESCSRCNIRYCLSTDELSNQCWILFWFFHAILIVKTAICYYSFIVVDSVVGVTSFQLHGYLTAFSFP